MSPCRDVNNRSAASAQQPTLSRSKRFCALKLLVISVQAARHQDSTIWQNGGRVLVPASDQSACRGPSTACGVENFGSRDNLHVPTACDQDPAICEERSGMSRSPTPHPTDQRPGTCRRIINFCFVRRCIVTGMTSGYQYAAISE